jgi:trehalose/maltose transport system permease protein
VTRPSNRSILFYVPAAALLLVVFAYPIARTIALSFSNMNLATAFQPEFAGSENYARLLSDSRFLESLRITGIFTIVSVALEFGLGLMLALAANNCIRGQGLVRSIFLAPWTLPTAIIAVLWAWIFNDQYGVLNAVLQDAGVISSPIAWLATPVGAMAAIIIADVWKTTPFVFLVLLAGLQNIPKDLYEAMEIDGGGAWAQFRYVTWPFLLPFVFIALVFRVIQAFAIFDLVWVMTGGGPGGSTETVSVYSYQTFMRYLDIGYGSAQVAATVVILSVVAFGLYHLLLRRYARLF